MQQQRKVFYLGITTDTATKQIPSQMTMKNK